MSYRIILEAAQPAINIDSKLINGAKLRFYDYDSLLPAPVYSSYSLSVSLGNEVTANNGFFPDMWAHNGQAYRVEWLDANNNILRVYDRIDAGTGKDILEALGTGLSGLYDDVNQALSDVSALEEIIRQKEIAITAINTALSEKQEIASEAASLADSARQIAQGARNATSAYKDAVMDAKTIVLENTEVATGAASAAALSAFQAETALNDTETGLASKASLESVNSLTVRIDTAEGQITNYFNLKADKTDLDLKLDASTYNGFIISYNDWKSGIESFTTSQLDTNTNLQGQINGKASTSSLNSAVSRLDGAESAINTLQTTTATKNYVDGQLLLKASASDVSQINLQLSGFGTGSGVVKSAVDAVSGRVLALENDHVTINQFNTLSGIIDAPGGLLSRMSAVEGITGSLSATYATLSSVSSLSTQVANNATAITTEATARSNADIAINNLIVSLTTRTAAAEASITDEATARSAADAANAASITTIRAGLGVIYSPTPTKSGWTQDYWALVPADAPSALVDEYITAGQLEAAPKCYFPMHSDTIYEVTSTIDFKDLGAQNFSHVILGISFNQDGSYNNAPLTGGWRNPVPSTGIHKIRIRFGRNTVNGNWALVDGIWTYSGILSIANPETATKVRFMTRWDSGNNVKGRILSLDVVDVSAAAKTEASLKNSQTAIASLSTSIADYQITTNTTLNGLTTTVNSQQTSINGILGKASVLIDANGRITGWQAIGGGTVSDFIIYANKFKFEDGTNAFSIENGVVYMNNAKIKNLTADNIALGAVSNIASTAAADVLYPAAGTNATVDILTLTITTDGGVVMVDATVNLQCTARNNNDAFSGFVGLYCDGVLLNAVTNVAYVEGDATGDWNKGGFPIALSWAHQPSAGNHTYVLKASLKNQTNYAVKATERTLRTMELKR